MTYAYIFSRVHIRPLIKSSVVKIQLFVYSKIIRNMFMYTLIYLKNALRFLKKFDIGKKKLKCKILIFMIRQLLRRQTSPHILLVSPRQTIECM